MPDRWVMAVACDGRFREGRQMPHRPCSAPACGRDWPPERGAQTLHGVEVGQGLRGQRGSWASAGGRPSSTVPLTALLEPRFPPPTWGH